VHPRFEQSRIERQGFSKCVLGLLVIPSLAEAFQDAIDVTTSERGVGEREVWIDLDSAPEVFDPGVEMLTLDCVIDERRETVATAQVFLGRRRVGSGRLS
jgi:hypothetical protein